MSSAPIGWTTLPPMPLRGLGTGFVESLGYYVLRISHCTGLSLESLGTLLDCKHRASFLHTLFSAGEGSERLATSLERLTGCAHLRRGTLWALNSIIAASSAQGTYWRRWCPTCYDLWDASTSYEPLLWSLGVIERCPIHEVALESNCHYCGAKQNSHIHIDRRRLCTTCKSQLGHRGRHYSLSTYKGWAERQAVDLVKLTSSTDTEPFDSEVYVTYCLGLFDNFYRAGRVPVILGQHIRNTQGHGYTPKPGLRTLINLCGLQGIDCRFMLMNPREAASRPLLEHWTYCYTSIELGRDHYGGRGDVALWLLDKLLRTRGYLPPIDVVMREMGLSVRSLREMNVDAYWQYQERYQQATEPSLRKVYGVVFERAVERYRANSGWSKNRDVRWLAAQFSIPSTALSPEAMTCVLESASHFVHLLGKARGRTWFEQLDLFKEMPWKGDIPSLDGPPNSSVASASAHGWKKRSPKWSRRGN